MSDPTVFAITASFCAALGIFAVAAWIRKILLKPAAASDDPELLITEEPPRQNVPTWFYQPLDLLAIGFIFLLYFNNGLSGASAAESPKPENLAGALIISIAFQFVCVGVVTGFVIHRIKPAEWLGLRWENWLWAFLIGPAGFILIQMFFKCLQAVGYLQWIESLGVPMVQDSVKLLQESADPLVLGLMALAAVIVAPFCEEIIFRGYLYPVAKKFVGPGTACVCSALVFSAAHGSMISLLPLFVFGCLLVYIYEKTGSIWAPMAVHFCFNGVTVLIQMLDRFEIISLPESL